MYNGQLRVFVPHAKKLKDLDTMGKSDPFCKLYLSNKQNENKPPKSIVIKDNLDPVWNFTHVFDVSVSEFDIITFGLLVHIYDEDTVGSEVIGGVTVPLKDIIFKPGI